MTARTTTGWLVALAVALGALTFTAGPAAAATGWTRTCSSANYGYTCVASSGYHGQSTWGYPVDARGHNCTNYAAYRLARNGAANPGNLGNAADWDNNAQAKGFTVNGTPTVGAIAQWEGNTGPATGVPEGHVAYVEAVTSTYIDISDDGWGGTTGTARIQRGGTWWPSHFLHIKDAAASFSAAPTPSISGPAALGGTLTAEPGAWSPAPSYAYQWRRNGAEIGGATGRSYTLTPDDALQQITVSVTGSRSGYVTTTRTSAALAGPDVDPDGDGLPGGQLPPATSVSGTSTADLVGFGSGGVVVRLGNGRSFSGGTQLGYVDSAGGWRRASHPRFVADVNGDRRADLVGFGNDGVWVELNTGSAFGAPRLVLHDFGVAQGWRVDRHPRVLADLDRDGRPDIVGFGEGGVIVSRNNGNGTFAAPVQWSTQFGYGAPAGGWRVGTHPRVVRDVNGDGRPDIVGFANDGVVVALNTGSAFAAAISAVGSFGPPAGWQVDKHPRVLADVDRDGRPDIVGFGNGGVIVSRNNGNGTFAAPAAWSTEFGYDAGAGGWKVGYHPRYVVDVNGDGRADIVGIAHNGVRVALSTGSAFAPSSAALANLGVAQGWRVDLHPRTLADVDRDGRPDLVGFADGGVVVAHNQGGGGFAAPTLWRSEYGASPSAGGWNRPDYLRFVVAAPLPVVRNLTSGPARITGKLKVGKRLAASASPWTAGTTVRYQWFANGKRIAGATRAGLKLTRKLAGKRIKVTITGTKADYRTRVVTATRAGKVRR